MRRLFITFILLCLGNALVFSQTDSSLAVNVDFKGFSPKELSGGPVQFQIDTSGAKAIRDMVDIGFNTSFTTFNKLFYKFPDKYTFWLKFELTNNSKETLQAYLYCGNINYIDCYLVSGRYISRVSSNGNLYKFPSGNHSISQMTQSLPISIQPQVKTEVYVKLRQKTENYDYDGITVYSEDALYKTIGEDALDNLHFFNLQALFQGILICQIIFVLFQWIIIRRPEYIYYFFYLFFIELYFLSRFENGFEIRLLFTRFPLLRVYLNKSLMILPYIFYFKFIRTFLDMPLNYPRLNTWILRIEYFLAAYVLADLVFIIITFDVKQQREIFTVIFLALFIASLSFIIYLFQEKKTLIYFILTGSLLAGLGNIVGLIFTYLENENILHDLPDKLIFSQVGIILEIFCFTAGLGYKSRSAEKEKTISQDKLIHQLRANELLQANMQAIRNNIAQDLHDDIGSTLSSISILSEMSIKKPDDKKNLSAMQEIKDSSQLLMEKMDDIVWSINPRNDSLENLLARIRRFSILLFEARNIDYDIRIQDNIQSIRLPMEWRQHIYLIVKEAVNNLAKYSEATMAVIQISYQIDALEVKIEDNGKGFDPSNGSIGNGLLSMKNRAGLMAGSLQIDSSPGLGCRVILIVKSNEYTR